MQDDGVGNETLSAEAGVQAKQTASRIFFITGPFMGKPEPLGNPRSGKNARKPVGKAFNPREGKALLSRAYSKNPTTAKTIASAV